MNPDRKTRPPEAVRFRTRLFVAMMGLIVAMTTTAFYGVRRSIASEAENVFERGFEGALAGLHEVQRLRHATIAQHSRTLAGKSRIHAALEDGALDLLYASARDELRDALASAGTPDTPGAYALRARFYRFLDQSGAVIEPAPDDETGIALDSSTTRQIALPRLADRDMTGYVTHAGGGGGVSEIITTPVISTATGQPIAALVLGFEPARFNEADAALPPFQSGVWLDEHLDLPGLSSVDHAGLIHELEAHVIPADTAADSGRFEATIGGSPFLVFHKILNPDSLYPPAREICLFPLAEMEAQQRRAGLRVLGAGTGLLLIGLLVTRSLSTRFSAPVARLADESRQQREKRHEAEVALEATSAELERAARFSADASHQLKTPVTVLRAGLEEVLARGAISEAEAEEIAALIHQTYRLSTIIDDLLLLSRVDAGQLKIRPGEVDLARLIEGSLDDLSATPDELGLSVESDIPEALFIAGERRYVALILQNLLENARKYNVSGGRIRIAAVAANERIHLTVGNTALRPIPPESQAHIFERFHRAAMGENIPGYGIGLNLARELARLHDGDLRLIRSDTDWTEFEVTFRPATRHDTTGP